MGRPKKKLVEENSLKKEIDKLKVELSQLIGLLEPVLTKNKPKTTKKRGRPAKKQQPAKLIDETPREPRKKRQHISPSNEELEELKEPEEYTSDEVYDPELTLTDDEEKEDDSPLPIGVARIKRKPQGGEIIIRDGQEHIVCIAQKINVKGKQNKFVDSHKLSKAEPAPYPEPGPRREPAKKINCVCDGCQRTIKLYPSQAPQYSYSKAKKAWYKTMQFKCDNCLRRR